MKKKYIVRFSAEERQECLEVIKKPSGSSQKVRRAQILLQSDIDEPSWTDQNIAEAYRGRTQTIEKIHQRLVTRGFRETLDGKLRSEPPTPKCLDGELVDYSSQISAPTAELKLMPPTRVFGKICCRRVKA